MATETSNKHKELLFKKVLDFANDTFKIILMEKGFVFDKSAHEVYADVSSSELATAAGYTAGGEALSGVAITVDDTNDIAYVSWNNPSWLADGGNIETDGAIIIDDSVASPVIDPIIGYIDFGETLITYDGGTFTIANIAVVNS